MLVSVLGEIKVNDFRFQIRDGEDQSGRCQRQQSSSGQVSQESGDLGGFQLLECWFHFLFLCCNSCFLLDDNLFLMSFVRNYYNYYYQDPITCRNISVQAAFLVCSNSIFGCKNVSKTNFISNYYKENNHNSITVLQSRKKGVIKKIVLNCFIIKFNLKIILKTFSYGFVLCQKTCSN